MHETPEDLERLQELLDRSHDAGGSHLRSIFDQQRRIPAAELPRLLTGVQILALATVTADCRPLVAPVDGLFFRSHWYFGSSHESVRFQHIDRRPQVSAAHVRGEELAVLTHGVAVPIDVSDPSQAGFRSYMLEVYVPLYGADFGNFADENRYARIDAERMFTFRNHR